MLPLKAFIKVLAGVPAAIGQVAAYRALGAAAGTLREEGYASIKPLSARAGEGCPEAWSAACDHQDQVPSWDRAEEPRRSSDPTSNTHTRDLSRVPRWGAPKKVLEVQS